MAKKIAAENEKGYTWSRKTPVADVEGTRYMLARIENEGEEPFHLVIVQDGREFSVLTRRDGNAVKIEKPSQFQTFLDALLSQ